MKCAVLLLLVSLTAAHDIIIAGDSWGTHGREPFLKMLKNHSSPMTVDNIAVSGTTSDDWVGHYNARLVKAVKDNPTAKVLWLTLGGNDAKDELPGCMKGMKACIAEVIAKVSKNMEKLFTDIFTNNKNIRVVGWGYDVMGFDKLPVCPALSEIILPACGNKPACVNPEFMHIQELWGTFAQNYTRVDTVNLVGSLQTAVGMAGASVGHPNMDHFSPNSLMEVNCIHPTSHGFDFIFENLWNLYLHKI